MKTPRVDDAATGAALQTLQGHTSYVRAVPFSPDGKLLASTSSDRTVRLWDVKAPMEMLPPPQQQAIELAFFRGMSQREIAANTNTPLGTVKTRLELGLKKIYDGLKELRDEL